MDLGPSKTVGQLVHIFGVMLRMLTLECPLIADEIDWSEDLLEHVATGRAERPPSLSLLGGPLVLVASRFGSTTRGMLLKAI